MESASPFLVYNASAGSGKTYTLVKTYLEKLLSNPDPEAYRHILAITFTNKAVAEMKSRILKVLLQLSEGDFVEMAESMADSFEKELNLDKSQIQQRSKKILKHLLNHYALFSVETIDRFNHRLLRTFSRDLGLNSNFEVSLETTLLLAEAVDQLISLAGEDPDITRWLVQFALQKTEEDKSWDVSRDLNQAAKMLTLENDLVYLEKLRGKDLSAFEGLRNKLHESIAAFEDELQLKAQRLLELFDENGLNASHFSGGYLYGYFKKISQGNTNISIDLKWQDKVGKNPLYNKSMAGSPEAQRIEQLVPDILHTILWIRGHYMAYLKEKNILNQLVPLATVHLVDDQLQALKSTYNLLPISEFNNLIHKEIKDQPAPFIYERLGERYHHYFIDEFQDTSRMQWRNLMPLAENPLAQSPSGSEGSIMIVGDAKQSIYRWRGGVPEQFIELYSDVNPFPFTKKTTRNLDTNYRSCREIVQFNNQFFTFISKQLHDEQHRLLYEEGSHQKCYRSCAGFVQIDFLECENAEETFEIHPNAVVVQVKALQERGFNAGSICVLTRKKEEGVAISEALTQQGIQVVSEETLLLKNAASVKVLIDLLQLSLFPEDDQAKVRILEYLAKATGSEQALHEWALQSIRKPIKHFQSLLSSIGVPINFQKTHSLGVFETFEYFVRMLGLHTAIDAFLVFFMDWVFQFSQNPMNSKAELLEYWELKKEELSIAAPNNEEAVRVMTIHKAKGLEFPIVIFPFAHLDIYYEKDPKIWYPWHSDGFEELPIRFKKEIEGYGSAGAELYQEHRNTLQLDNLNLLYVALTRAKQELYVLSRIQSSNEDLKTYSHFFEAYLREIGMWDENNLSYSFGKQETPIVKEPLGIVSDALEYPISSPEERGLTLTNAFLRKSKLEAFDARDFGTVFHEFMAQITCKDDLSEAWTAIEARFVHLEAQRETLFSTANRIIDHPELYTLFDTTDKVYVEKEIITPQGVIRPDRINIHSDKSATLLDYKTGEFKQAHIGQLKSYANALESMGYSLRNSYLVYAQPEQILVNKAYL